MEHQFKIASCQYTIQVDDKPTRQEVTLMSQVTPDTPWADLWDLCTPEYRLQLRVDDIIKQATKKLHKPRITASRRYPRNGAQLSTEQYIANYFQINGNARFGGISAYCQTQDHLALYQPLSTRVTPVDGEYTEETIS
jgi:hypothetical protein